MNELLPNERISITVAGDTLILSGVVWATPSRPDQALSLANAYVQRSARSSSTAGAAASAAPPPARPRGRPPRHGCRHAA